MPMIQAIEVENFRCFRTFRAADFTRVNFFVGRNNSGKTALLEALEAVLSEDSPFILYRASIERGEFRPRSGPGAVGEVELDVRRWFHGHRLDATTSFAIRTTGERSFSLSRSIRTVPNVPGGRGLTLERPASKSHLPVLPLTPDDFLGGGAPGAYSDYGARLSPPVRFITSRRLLPADLLPLWERVLLTPFEADVVTSMRLLDPAIERLAIAGTGGAVVAKVLLSGSTEPVPLGTLGEGAVRVLTLALQLATAREGFLLIDEIESGLHWSVMPGMWRFLVEAARKLDVQVFATTHSKDCLEAIAGVYEESPELAADVTVHRLEAGASTAVRMTAATIAGTLDGRVEVR